MIIICAVIIFFIIRFIIKRKGTVKKCGLKYAEVKDSTKNIKNSYFRARALCFENPFIDDTKFVGIASGKFIGRIGFWGNGIIVNLYNCAPIGLEKENVEEIIIKRTSGRDSWWFSCRVYIYSTNSVCDNLNLVTTDDGEKLLSNMFGDRVIYE